MKAISLRAAADARQEAEKQLTAAVSAAMKTYHEATGAHISGIDANILKHTTTYCDFKQTGEPSYYVLVGVKIETTVGTDL